MKKTKPVARKIKATWKLDPKEATKKVEAKQVTYKVNLNYMVMLPPPKSLDQCPRCGKPHKKIKPLKFLKPMEFFTKGTKGKDKGKSVLSARSSHWFLCPKTKEPVIFFDHYVTAENIENYVAKTMADDIATQIDKELLAELKTLAEQPKRQEIRVRYKGGKTQAWVYDPNALERVVPGTKKEAAAQRARVLAQEKATAPAREEYRRKRR